MICFYPFSMSPASSRRSSPGDIDSSNNTILSLMASCVKTTKVMCQRSMSKSKRRSARSSTSSRVSSKAPSPALTKVTKAKKNVQGKRFTSEEFQTWRSNNLTRLEHLQVVNKNLNHPVPSLDEVQAKFRVKFAKKKQPDLLRLVDFTDYSIMLLRF